MLVNHSYYWLLITFLKIAQGGEQSWDLLVFVYFPSPSPKQHLSPLGYCAPSTPNYLNLICSWHNGIRALQNRQKSRSLESPRGLDTIPGWPSGVWAQPLRRQLYRLALQHQSCRRPRALPHHHERAQGPSEPRRRAHCGRASHRLQRRCRHNFSSSCQSSFVSRLAILDFSVDPIF